MSWWDRLWQAIRRLLGLEPPPVKVSEWLMADDEHSIGAGDDTALVRREQ